ncbi:hypothetical protein CEXT_125671 [Caerostris extrusa]|uniref:Uncharacterized protein n=1 Tax=Caerostris extrusa TaxID=172846 RepID=A0AAV4NKK6_CAEEX|nr:hypothetical protein CEXT_125671 [Caerostris extrusa]
MTQKFFEEKEINHGRNHKCVCKSNGEQHAGLDLHIIISFKFRCPSQKASLAVLENFTELPRHQYHGTETNRQESICLRYSEQAKEVLLVQPAWSKNAK